MKALAKRGQMLHDFFAVLVFQLLNDVEIGFLGGGNAGMSEPFGNAGNGNASENEQRGMSMAKAMHRYHWHISLFA